MFKRRYITIDWLNQYRSNLIEFSNITESQIRDIWFRKGETHLEDFSALEYDSDAPLYQKMIFRFRNGGNLASRLCNQIDPSNQSLILCYFGMTWNDGRELIDFFAWISNSLGIYHILELEGCIKENSTYIKIWKENDINFFFSLPLEKQIILINKCNEMLKRYNEG